MLTKKPDLQKWADSILATEPSERAEMVAEDPSVFEVVRKALDAERQTVAKLRDENEKLEGRWQTAVEVCNQYRERAWKAEDALANAKINR